jgi:hypothetical protein
MLKLNDNTGMDIIHQGVNKKLLERVLEARKYITVTEQMNILSRIKAKAKLNRTVAYRVTNYY